MLLFYYHIQQEVIMAGRGRKSYTLEEKLEITLQDIEKTKEYLKKLEDQKEKLQSQIRTKQLEEIDKLISDSGKSFEEIRTMLIIG